MWHGGYTGIKGWRKEETEKPGPTYVPLTFALGEAFQFALRHDVKIKITVEIQAGSPSGFDDGLQRVVKDIRDKSDPHHAKAWQKG